MRRIALALAPRAGTAGAKRKCFRHDMSNINASYAYWRLFVRNGVTFSGWRTDVDQSCAVANGARLGAGHVLSPLVTSYSERRHFDPTRPPAGVCVPTHGYAATREAAMAAFAKSRRGE
jgi:hypothetical protein